MDFKFCSYNSLVERQLTLLAIRDTIMRDLQANRLVRGNKISGSSWKVKFIIFSSPCLTICPLGLQGCGFSWFKNELWDLVGFQKWTFCAFFNGSVEKHSLNSQEGRPKWLIWTHLQIFGMIISILSCILMQKSCVCSVKLAGYWSVPGPHSQVIKDLKGMVFAFPYLHFGQPLINIAMWQALLCQQEI